MMASKQDLLKSLNRNPSKFIHEEELGSGRLRQIDRLMGTMGKKKKANVIDTEISSINKPEPGIDPQDTLIHAGTAAREKEVVSRPITARRGSEITTGRTLTQNHSYIRGSGGQILGATT